MFTPTLFEYTNNLVQKNLLFHIIVWIF